MAFKAALFDMDGTLLDSMDVWAQVDDEFFLAHGMTSPDDYGPALAGLSLRQSAEYTKARFGFPESIEEIIASWNRSCVLHYEQQVPLKAGAAAYLHLLKRHGVKIAAATALDPHLFIPALKRLGVYHLFDAFATVSETNQPKISGATYALAAQRLNVDPADCIVFEDILEGHIGARAAGMRSCNVYDRHADRKRAEIAAIADWCTRDFSDAPLPDCCHAWNRAVIVPSWPNALPLDEIRPTDCVIAVDHGCHICRKSGIEPDFCLGDFDSLQPGESIPAAAILHPREKDDTDTALALKHALSLGLTEICLVGGVGGRLDHTIANLQLMRYAASRSAQLTIRTVNETARLLLPGTHILPPQTEIRTFSLLAFSPQAEGLSIRGARYCVENGALSDSFPLGISNETLPGQPVEITFSAGSLLLIENRLA